MADTDDEWFDDPSVPNNGPETNGTVWALTLFATAFLGVRLFCKIRKHRGLWWDDWFLVASWAAQVLSAILISVNVSQGFGNESDNINPKLSDGIGLRGVVIGTLLICSTAWSKTSIAITLFRIAGPRMKISLWVIIVSMNLFMNVAASVQWFQCSPAAKIWNPSLAGACWDPEVNLGFAIGSSGYSAFLDIVLAFLPWTIILNLQMKRKEKIEIAIVMSMGIFASATAVVKCIKLKLLESADFTYEGGDLIDWAVGEITATIVAASMPVLRTLIHEAGSGGASRAYFRATSHNEMNTKSRVHPTGINTITVSASGRATPGSNDTDNDRWILHGTAGGGIIKTDEIMIRYGSNSEHGNDLSYH